MLCPSQSNCGTIFCFSRIFHTLRYEKYMRVWLWLLYFFSVVNICLIEHCFRRLFTVYIFYFLFAVWFRDIYENNMFNCFVMGDTGIVTRRHINEESIRRDEVVVGRQFKDLSSGRRPHRRKLFCDRFMYVSHWKIMFVINFFLVRLRLNLTW